MPQQSADTKIACTMSLPSPFVITGRGGVSWWAVLLAVALTAGGCYALYETVLRARMRTEVRMACGMWHCFAAWKGRMRPPVRRACAQGIV